MTRSARLVDHHCTLDRAIAASVSLAQHNSHAGQQDREKPRPISEQRYGGGGNAAADEPKSSCADRFSLSLPADTRESRFDNKSINASTALVRLPVITAVEIVPGMAKRSNAY